MEQVVSNILSFALANLPGVLITFVVGVILPLVYKWLDANATRAQIAMLSDVCDIAYPIVEGMARLTPTPLDDKAVAGFGVLRDQLKVRLRRKDEDVARAIFTAKHEREKQKTAASK